MTQNDISYGKDMPDEEIESITVQRDLKGSVGLTVAGIAIVMSLVHIYMLNFKAIEPWVFRSMHITFGMVLGFALFPGWRQKNSSKIHWTDYMAILASIGIFLYIYINLSTLQFRAGVMPNQWDVVIAVVGTFLVLELTRRTSGWSLPILASIFIAYAFLGPYLPGMLFHNGYSYQRFFSYIYGLDGIFGITVDVSSKYILLFIIFGAFLQASKVGNYFVDFSFSVAGGLRGGPAKVAVIASALMGMMNGTSAGNAVATGSLTIPLMKRVGYNPRFAAATEATASTGGQLMPPIMGAGAFIMAEILGIKYSEIVLAAIIPSLLYFTSVYFMIDLEAIKKGLRGLKRSELPNIRLMLKKSYLFIPVIVLIGSLLMGYSIIRSGTVGILACFFVSWISKETRMGWRETFSALENGAKSMISLLAVCASAGIVVGVIALTGVGMKFSSMLLNVAGTSQLLALVFAMLLAILLGMGMPTTAAYAVAASVVAPGLIRMGIEPLHAHMFVFYYAVVSAITPPVAMAAFAAAGVGGTDPMKTSIQAFRLGLAAYLVPFMFMYSPSLLMDGSALKVTMATITALVGVFFLASTVQGYFFGYVTWIQRVMLMIASLALINAGLTWDVIGLSLGLSVYLLGKFMNKNKDGNIGQQLPT